MGAGQLGLVRTGTGTLRHSPEVPPPPQSRTAPRGHHSPAPGKHLLLVPASPPRANTHQEHCSKLLQPKLKLHSAAAPGLPAESEGSITGMLQIVHNCPDPFNLTTPTQPLQLPPIHPNSTNPLRALAHLLFQRHLSLPFLFPPRHQAPQAGLPAVRPCSVGQRQLVVLTLGSAGRCGGRGGAAQRGCALASPLALMQSCREPHANDAAPGIPAQGGSPVLGESPPRSPAVPSPGRERAEERRRARSCTAGREREAMLV